MANNLLDEVISAGESGEKIFSVSVYLDLLNEGLKSFSARVRGEVSSIDEREKAVYFNLKDATDGSVINCLIWKSNYRLSGVRLEPGLEVIVAGNPDIYKPIGRMSFKANTVELVGEGSLKAAYDKLKAKLEAEGLFAPARKKEIPDFPEKIGVLTSKNGAVINDFLNNIGRHGFKIRMLDSRVEGQAAVVDIARGLKYFKTKDIDVLIVIRGGGSLESMQAFNNEELVRMITDYPVPIIAGIGHDKDVPLFALASDVACSTPTAVTRILNRSWEEAVHAEHLLEKSLLDNYSRALEAKKNLIRQLASGIKDRFAAIFRKASELEFAVKNILARIERNIAAMKDKIGSAEAAILLADPGRQLALGYSIISARGKIIRSVGDVKEGDEVEARLADGKLSSEIKKIWPNQK